MKKHSSGVRDEGESTLSASKSLVKFKRTPFKSLFRDHHIPPSGWAQCAEDLWFPKGYGTNLTALASQGLHLHKFIHHQLMSHDKLPQYSVAWSSKFLLMFMALQVSWVVLWISDGFIYVTWG